MPTKGCLVKCRSLIFIRPFSIPLVRVATVLSDTRVATKSSDSHFACVQQPDPLAFRASGTNSFRVLLPTTWIEALGCTPPSVRPDKYGPGIRRASKQFLRATPLKSAACGPPKKQQQHESQLLAAVSWPPPKSTISVQGWVPAHFLLQVDCKLVAEALLEIHRKLDLPQLDREVESWQAKRILL